MVRNADCDIYMEAFPRRQVVFLNSVVELLNARLHFVPG